MPVEMLKDLIGQTVAVMVAGELVANEYTLLEVCDNWIKVENKKQIAIINGDMISGIYVNKPKTK